MQKPTFQLNQHIHTLPLPGQRWLHGAKYRKIKHQISHNTLVQRKVLRVPLLAFVPLSLIALFIIFTGVFFFAPRSVSYAYSGSTCVFNPQFIPNFTAQKGNGAYAVSNQSAFSLFGYPVYTSKTCVSPLLAPEAGAASTIRLAPLSLPLLEKKITIIAPEPPMVSATLEDGTKIATAETLVFALSAADHTHDYSLYIGDKSAGCVTHINTLQCPLESLQLTPGKSYDYTLNRQFNGASLDPVVVGMFKTLDPVIIKSSSIAKDAKVYQKPTTITLTTNKPLVDVSDVSLTPVSPAGNAIKATVSAEDKNITISFGELARSTTYKLSIGNAKATDGSLLLKPYELTFRTTGGPQLVSSSIPSYGVNQYETVVLSFDVGLKAGQNISSFASILIDGNPVAASVYADGNKIYINPVSALPSCRDFSVRLNGGLVSQYDVGGGTAWSMNSRTTCRQAFTIGSSVLGRSIVGYRFGNGASKVVYVGGVHGDEKSSVYILNSWMDYLERRYRDIPSARSIIVIPNANPDGFAANTRNNANNVDLNRNFPSNDWTKDAQGPGGGTVPGSGGNAPLDQPESQALASYIGSINPRLVITYHAVASYVISNDAGDSITLGSKYAQESGFYFTSSAGTDSVFAYATTGEFEDWLVDRKGITGFLVELSTNYGNEFYRHQTAMWNTATIDF